MTKVITYGTFDLFHEGHYRLLRRAKELGDYLIVGVTTEKYDMERGKLNVVDSLVTRIESVKKSGFADEIIIEEADGQKISDVQKYHVDIFAVGSDWAGKFDYISEYCRVAYIERTRNISSTMLRERGRHIQKIGVIGTGRVAGRFMTEEKLVSGMSTQGVYNPNIESAERFAKNWGIDFYTGIEDFYGGVDAVYVASPHQTHYKYAREALEHGKHVLCEKPMALTKKESEELFSCARERRLVLFEGIKTAYCPGFEKLLGIACSGTIGDIKYVDACFTKLEGRGARELTDTKYGGSFTELASYCLLPAIKLLGTGYSDIRFDVIHGENGLDIFTKASLSFPRGIATAACGLGVKAEGRLLVGGTRGYIVAEAPWWKTAYFEVHYEDPNRVEKYSERFFGAGLRYELKDFLNMINGDGKNAFKLTGGESVALAGIMEKFMEHEGRQ